MIDTVLVKLKKKDFDRIATNGAVEVAFTHIRSKVLYDYQDYDAVHELLFRLTTGKEENVMYELSKHALHEIKRWADDPTAEWAEPEEMEVLSRNLESIIRDTNFQKKTIAVYWV